MLIQILSSFHKLSAFVALIGFLFTGIVHAEQAEQASAVAAPSGPSAAVDSDGLTAQQREALKNIEFIDGEDANNGADAGNNVKLFALTLKAKECVNWSGNLERDRDNSTAQAWGNVIQQVAERAGLMDVEFKKRHPKKRRIETFKKASFSEARKYTDTLRPSSVSNVKQADGSMQLCSDVMLNKEQLAKMRDLLIDQEDKLSEDDITALKLAFNGRARKK